MSIWEVDTLGYGVKVTQIALRGAMEDRLRPLDVSLAQYVALAELERMPNQTNAELARRAFITAQSMQAVLAKLEARGLISRDSDPEHGRRQPAKLTEAGRALLVRAREVTREVETALEAAIAPHRKAEIVALLGKMHAALQNLESDRS